MRRYTPVVLLSLLFAACSAAERPAVSTSAPTTAPSQATTAAAETTTTRSSVPATEPSPTTSPPPPPSLSYEEVGSADFPIALLGDPVGERELLALKSGLISDLANGDVLLDLTGPVRDRGEQGLLGIELGADGSLFVHYTDGAGDTMVSRFDRSDSGFDPASETVMLRLDQPAANHNGGMLQFGPDRRLYVGLGDGGAANDRFGNGQNLDSLLGGLVAIDIDTGESELAAAGLRNPWRFWIDEESGVIAIADVGQDAREEISIVPFDGTFYNFGWPVTEGLGCFRPATGCDTSGLVEPVLDVDHGEAGTCSITGGVVYRGSAIPQLAGQFLFSDFCGGYLRSIDVTAPERVVDWTEHVGRAGSVTSFGTDRNGEVYVLTTTEILRIVAQR